MASRSTSRTASSSPARTLGLRQDHASAHGRGFCDLDRGAIHFGERRIDTLPPHRRSAGMVFQNYAIFPNLSVAGNVAYGLKARRVPAHEIAGKVSRALKLVHLDGYGERWPHQLSGGQLQRVAIARCLVIEPAVLLLDEPLSNLDAQLRVEMRGEIRQLQQTLKITALYVTHDQEEALAISDRIAVMRAGRLEQVGAPAAIYNHPASPFVAEFMGTTNLLRGAVTGGPIAAEAGAWVRVQVGGQDFLLGARGARAGATITFSLRPESLRPVASGVAPPAGWRFSPRGSNASSSRRAHRMDMQLADGTRLRVAALDLPQGWVRQAATVELAYDPARVTAFAAQ